MRDKTPLIRLNKYLAQCGVASRRGAEELIRSGRVTIDGIPVRTPDQDVPLGSVVEVDGKPAEPTGKRIVIALNKPPNVVTTVRDPQGRTTVMDLLPSEYAQRGIVPIGRLDRDSCGLLLLTNDGELVQALLQPASKVWKKYQVAVSGEVTPSKRKQLESGVSIDGRETKPAQVRVLGGKGSATTRMEISISEGRKRQIRRMCKKVGLQVKHLQRIAFGPVRLGKLQEGECRVLSNRELTALCEAGGL